MPGLTHRQTSTSRQLRIIYQLFVPGVVVLTMACTSPGRPVAGPAAETPPAQPAVSGLAAENSRALPPRSNLSLQDRASWRPILSWPEECESAFQASHPGDDPGIAFHELAPQLSVVEVLCAAGSYQASTTFIRLDERSSPRQTTVLRFPVYESGNGTAFTTTETSEVWGEIAIDPQKPLMTVLNLARQTADCGVWTQYNIGDSVPAVVDARARLPCPALPGAPIGLDIKRPPVEWRRLRSER